ncbi:MAG: rhomboid family intramembrane serine protease [Candidatus Krumholzibacteria bacterium]|nr:rhomboid family intramembrane serine protease [Candidatus Krumholzibacteria bacterium]
MQDHFRKNPLSSLLNGSVVSIIIIANVLVFILQMLLFRTPFQAFFALFPRLVFERGFIWQIVTYMFLHGGMFHLFFNMLIIWMFGSTLEQIWGGRKFLQYYFICGLGAALFSFIFSFNVPVIGASGAGYGILLAYGILFPHNQIYVWGIFPVRARTLVIVLGGIEFLSGLSGGDGIAHFAHLGGMAAGLIYLRTDHRSGRAFDALSRLWAKIPFKITFNNDTKAGDAKENNARTNDAGGNGATKVDSILDKISEKGYENLTETEKRILDKYSENNEKEE